MKINKEEIYGIISSILDINTDLVKSLGEDEEFTELGMKSKSAIQLIVMLEEKYEFELRFEDLLFNKFNTYTKLFCLLESY